MRGELTWLTVIVTVLCATHFDITQAQSNYVQHGNSGNYTTNGLPEEATLDGKVSLVIGNKKY